jgi:uncharacterized protein YjiS (DUF1127 family)
MTTYDTTARPTFGAFALFGQALTVFADWNDARLTRKALSQLTARELDDIGLCFGDIDRIAQRRINA